MFLQAGRDQLELERVTDIALGGELCSRARKSLTRWKAEIPAAHGLNSIGAVTLIDESKFLPVLDLSPVCLEVVRIRCPRGDPTPSSGGDVVPVRSLSLSTSAQLVLLSAQSPATGQNLQLRPLAATDGLLPGIKHSLLLLASLDDHSSGDPRIVRLRYCSLRRVEGARLYYCRLFR